MDVFKLRLSDSNCIEITRKNFEKETKQQEPWYQSLNGKDESHLAICPACDNTITIIGLHANETQLNSETGEIQTKEDCKPHGRHYLYKQLDNLGILDREAYQHCPYSGKRKLTKGSKHSNRSKVPSRIRHILSENLDRVWFMLSKSIGIYMSYNQFEDMVIRYNRAEGWRYAGATVMNIPWIFGYFSRSTSLRYKSIRNENIRAAIAKEYPDAIFESKYFNLNSKERAINPCFCFENHTRNVTNEHLDETIDLVITNDDGNEIYRQVIEFEHQYFINVINKKDTLRNEYIISMGEKYFS